MEDQYREEVTQTPEQPQISQTVEPEENATPISSDEDIPQRAEPVMNAPSDYTDTQDSTPDIGITPTELQENEPTYATSPSFGGNTPEIQPISFTPVLPVKEKEKTSKGLKVFSLLLSVAILLTAFSAAGYYIGRNHSFKSAGKAVQVDLAAKPKNTDEMTAAEVYDAVKDSVAGIMAYDESGNSVLISGVFCSKDGYLVTNDHVYEKISDPKFLVYTADGKEYEAEFVAGDTISDLTVLKTKEGTFKAATFGNPEELFCGENTVVMENIGESGDHVTVSRGTVISTGLRVRRENTSYTQRLIVTDHTVLNGATGGALVNMYGQVIGLTSYTNEGACYAIPSKLVKRYVEDMTKNGRITTRAKLGITYKYINSITKEAKQYQAIGALVDSVSSDSDLSGKIKKGDIITAFNGEKITSEDHLLNLIEDSSAKQKATVTFVGEDGEEETVEFVLGANVGESAYRKEITSENSDLFGQNPDSGGTFDFPRGE